MGGDRGKRRWAAVDVDSGGRDGEERVDKLLVVADIADDTEPSPVTKGGGSTSQATVPTAPSKLEDFVLDKLVKGFDEMSLQIRKLDERVGAMSGTSSAPRPMRPVYSVW
ncbi:hypothetical protein L7F22_027972 [Adiantum nelumboides]|nr:hypothetical protein [Adiantum nelumboides]